MYSENFTAGERQTIHERPITNIIANPLFFFIHDFSIQIHIRRIGVGTRRYYEYVTEFQNVMCNIFLGKWEITDGKKYRFFLHEYYPYESYAE